MSSSRYSSQAHLRDNRTQLFSNVGNYSSAQIINGSSGAGSSRNGSPNSYMSATPNSKGQYSDAVLSQLESQNDDHIEGLTAKVKILKDVASKIGDEVRDSNKLIETMEENFESARVKLKGTFTRMLRMAERSGVGWRAWLLLFAFISLIFFFVWWR